MRKLLFVHSVRWIAAAAAMAALPFVVPGCGACTAVGCLGGLQVNVVGVLPAFKDALPLTATACLGSDCYDVALSADAGGNLVCSSAAGLECIVTGGNVSFELPVDFEGTSPATFALADASGTIYQDTKPASLADVYPNGESCGAACRAGALYFFPTRP